MSKTLGKLILTFASVLAALTAGAHAENTNCDSCCGKWNVFTEWLYWRPCADGIYVALSGDVSKGQFDGEEIDVGSVRVKPFDYDLTGGFRIGLGYSNPDCYCWDFNLEWTNFNPSEDRKIKEKAPGGVNVYLFPFFCQNVFFDSNNLSIDLSDSPIVFADDIRFVDGHWDLDLNMVDADLSFPVCLNECFQLTPHFGVRYVSIEQKLRSKAFADELGGDFDSFDLKQRYQNDFCAVGPRAGLGAVWELGCGFGLYGDCAIALAFGKREASSKIAFETFSSGSATDNGWKTKSDDDVRCSRAITDLAIGCTWSKTVCDCVESTIRIGWEHHYFFNQGVADGVAGCTLISKDEDSDLSTQGLVLGLDLRF